MDNTSGQFVSKGPATRPAMLSLVDWRVWWLGFGVGGCCGLSFFAGAWSLLVDDNLSLGISSLAISSIHACLLTLFWMRRHTTTARSAKQICCLVGALGISLVAIIMTAGDSQVPALGSLYSLAMMNLMIGFFPLPIQTNDGLTK